MPKRYLCAAALKTARRGACLALVAGLGVASGLAAEPYRHDSAPFVYERPPHPYRELPPPAYYGQAPFTVMGPAPRPGGRVSPDTVFASLEAAGYHDFGPMAARNGVYRLSAVNPHGDLVALEIGIATGWIVRELILAERARQPRPIERQPAPKPPETRDPLVIY